MSVRVVPGVVAALLGAVVLAIPATPAHAHNVLRSTNPTDGQVLAVPPRVVVLTFDRPVLAIGSAVTVTGPGGQVQDGRVQVVDGTVRQSLASTAPAGRYTVAWRVTSVDGHPITGTFGFTARASRNATPSTGPSGSAAVSPTAGATAASGAPGASSTGDSGDDTPWTAILVAGVAGTISGIAVVLFQRRRRAAA